ncbi:GntR family transcriptional regulator [Actinocatenispora sera]|uniref:GntR family transcriptional regulator n=1 Tax=Actinocatenispora sera TaxID=390989 RepID=A0A810L0G8_9ACTN|nr:GntR family transcriptional regulator [Actinocatenispora sera]BCJ28289.1 GntR family transcriptional regulator [Actinocatenispora sera]
MPREPSDKRPPSRRIADDLREQIKNGTYGPGDKLPSERKLAAQYGSARNTAAEAIDILRREGLAVAKHGAGAFVRLKPALLRLGSNRYSRTLRETTGLSPYRAEVTKQGRTPRVACTSIERVDAPEDVAQRLGLNDDDRSVVRRENWYFADDEPVQVGVTFIPWAIADGSVLATSANMGKGSLYARFEDLGHPLTRIREEISARMPTPEEVAGLVIPDGVPVLEVLHTGIDDNGDPFEVTRFVMRADFNALDYNMPIED